MKPYDEWKLASPAGDDAPHEVDAARARRFASPRSLEHPDGCEGCPRCIVPDGRKRAPNS